MPVEQDFLTPAAEWNESIVEQQLHGATLVLPAVRLVTSSLVPVAIACFVLTPPVALLGFVVFVFAPGLVDGWIRYRTVRFALAADGLAVQSGWIERVRREVPWSRIQEMKVEQPLIYRPFRLAVIHATTAGQNEEEVRLDVITVHQAEAMLAALGHSRAVEPPGIHTEPKPTHFDFECSLTLRELVVGGLTSHLVTGVIGLVTTLVYFQAVAGKWFRAGDWLDRIDPFARVEAAIRGWIPDFGVFDAFVDFLFEDTLGKGLVYVGLGLTVSVIAFVFQFYDYRLRRKGDQLYVEHGLFTRKRQQVSRSRLQAVQVEEGLLRRCFGLASVYADSAGDHQAQENRNKREVLLPVVSQTLASRVVEEVFCGLSAENTTWKRPSRLAIGRGTRKGAALVVLSMLQVSVWSPVGSLLMSPAFLVVYFLNRKWYQHSLYRVGRSYLVVKRGWLSRTTRFMPISKVQNLMISRSPFDRRLGLASLRLDTAGQSNTGGGPNIRNLTVRAALRLHRDLASQVARQPFAW